MLYGRIAGPRDSMGRNVSCLPLRSLATCICVSKRGSTLQGPACHRAFHSGPLCVSCLAPAPDVAAALSYSNVNPLQHYRILCNEQSAPVSSSAPTSAFIPASCPPSCLLRPLLSTLWRMCNAYACQSLQDAPSQSRPSKLLAPYPPTGRCHPP